MSTQPTDDPDWVDGDMELVSSDNVRFMVKEYVLLAASCTLAGKLESHVASATVTPCRITLTDSEIERAQVVRMFLVVATVHRVPLDEEDRELQTVTKLVRFITKWDCSGLLNIVCDNLLLGLKKKRLYPLRVFQVAALLDDVDFARECVEGAKDSLRGDPWWDEQWSTYDKTYPHSKLSLGYPFDPRGWTTRFYQEHRIPADYLSALSRASWDRDDSEHPNASLFSETIQKEREKSIQDK